MNRVDACHTWFSTVKCLSHLFRRFHSCPLQLVRDSGQWELECRTWDSGDDSPASNKGTQYAYYLHIRNWRYFLGHTYQQSTSKKAAVIIITWKGCKFFAAPGVERHLPLAWGLCLYTFDGSRSHIREVAKYERRQSKGDDKSTVGGRSRLASAPSPAGGGGGGPGAVRHLPFFARPDDDLLDTPARAMLCWYIWYSFHTQQYHKSSGVKKHKFRSVYLRVTDRKGLNTFIARTTESLLLIYANDQHTDEAAVNIAV